MHSIHIGTCLDTGHAYLSGDLYKVMHKLSGHLQLIHANDNSGNYDDHKPPGEGNIDWNRFLSEDPPRRVRADCRLSRWFERQALENSSYVEEDTPVGVEFWLDRENSAHG